MLQTLVGPVTWWHQQLIRLGPGSMDFQEGNELIPRVQNVLQEETDTV